MPRALGLAIILTVLSLAASAAFGQRVPNRYALILDEPPVTTQYASPGLARSAAAMEYRQQLEARHRILRSELAARNVQVTGTARTLVNAVFVAVPADRVDEMRTLAGVVAVVPVRRYRPSMNRAANLINAPAAWSLVGGQANGGAGVKIAVLDTGIDQTHPAFQDSSLAMPAGYPRCSGDDCAYTSNKVIAARSYVRLLAAGTSAANPAEDSRPDDYSPRDRMGHGTAVASVAAGVSNTGVVTVSGVAPKAYLGNYKIYGSPEVNDYTGDDVIIQALEDAMDDGMDIISFSTGSPATTGALDTGSACGLAAGAPCDLSATAFENAARAGIVVVVAAGNEADTGTTYPTYGTVSSPANAPSVIGVGATSNSHYFSEAVSIAGQGAPSNLKNLTATPSSDANSPGGAMTAPLIDVTSLGNDGLACSALPAGSLTGKFALVQRGTCTFVTKAAYAVQAGATGVVFYAVTAGSLDYPSGLTAFSIPIAMVSQADGLALKSYLATNPGAPATIDPYGREVEWPYPNELAVFSSRGPAIGDAAIKPDLVAPGEDIYMAAESYDPLGFMYSSGRYLSASGTSFATPMTAGAAALVKQNHPGFTAAQVKSALVNNASQDVTTDEYGIALDVRDLGAGKLNAVSAVSAAVTVIPATLSFGELAAGSLPLTRQFQVTNTSSSPISLTLAVASAVASIGTNLTLDKSTLALLANSSDTVTATLAGSTPAAGVYSGAVTAQGTGVSLRVPFQFLVSSGNTASLVGLAGGSFDGTVGQTIPEGVLAFKAMDTNGLPVRGLPVTWSATGGGRITSSDSATDNYGIAYAEPVLGSTVGSYSFTASAGARSLRFSGTARAVPTISASGVVNAASFQSGAAVAPGSYAALFGASLSDTTNQDTDTRLPLAIDYAHVSFDVPSAGISVPGRLTYVSPGQVNVQVPWELQGQASAQVKVTISDSYGNVVTVPLADFAPAFFEISGAVAALDTSNNVVSSSNPAIRGRTIQIFANGLGPVTNQPASGEPALASPLSETTTKPVVTIGGRAVTVDWSGLTPTLPGLYQINVTLPADLPTGSQTITLSIGGAISRSSTIPIQ